MLGVECRLVVDVISACFACTTLGTKWGQMPGRVSSLEDARMAASSRACCWTTARKRPIMTCRSRLIGHGSGTASNPLSPGWGHGRAPVLSVDLVSCREPLELPLSCASLGTYRGPISQR